nr:glycosyltransferase [uncultured Rhodopila sp.]
MTVSVIIPAYNAAETVAYAVTSCIAQSAHALEVLVVDDGSTDDTAEIVSRFGAPVRLMRQHNRGPGAARNAAARQARGEWLAFLDADDWWMPDKLERQLKLAEPDVGIIHSLANVSVPGIPDLIGFDDLWQRNLIVNSSVLIRKTAFEALGGFIEHPELFVCEDYNLWLRAAAEGVKIKLCRELLTYYRPGQGISSNAKSFFEGSDRNLSMIGARYRLDPVQVEEKRTCVMFDIGLMALGQRNLPLARFLLKAAFLRKPQVRTCFHSAVAHLSDSTLDLVRRSRGGYQRSRHRCIDDPTVSFTRGNDAPIGLAGGWPAVLVIIDTEEEFDWATLPPVTMGVRAMRHQEAAYRILRKHGIVPTYAVDYMIATDRDAYAPLQAFVAEGGCEIGSQLHTWVNPPLLEARSLRNTYAGNLPAWLEFEKIARLTQTIEDNLGIKPILYRGGRYGSSPYTARILKWLGYKVDCTVLPFFDLRDDGGPDYRQSPNQPGWRDPDRQLLEIPATVGMSGLLRRWGAELYPHLNHPVARYLGAPSLLRRLNILDRNRLTPEGASLADLKRLARDLVQRDRSRVLVLSFHSSSLLPGNTPYVRTARDLDAFLGRMDEFLGFVMDELHGVPVTPADVYRMASAMSGPGEPVAQDARSQSPAGERVAPA